MSEMAKTLLKKSDGGSVPGQLECVVVQGVSRCGYAYEICVQEVWKCAFLSSNNRLFFKGKTSFN